MQTIALKHSDLKLSRIIFGAWAIGGWYWGLNDDNESIRAIHAGIEHGITSIDTAPVYGFGHSEEIVGRAIAGKRSQVQIATKCGLRWDTTEGNFFFEAENPFTRKTEKVYRNLQADSIRYEIEQSLRRLRVETIDLYQCHWPDKTTAIDETAEILLRLKQEGKIRAIGVSNFQPSMMADFQKIAQLDTLQPKYNLLERGIETEILPYTRKHKIAVIAYSPLAQGLLTGKITPEKQYQEGDYRKDKPAFQSVFLEQLQPGLELMQQLAKQYNTTIANIAIAWLLAQPGISAAICGIRTKEQAIENSAGADLSLSSDEILKIEEKFSHVLMPAH